MQLGTALVVGALLVLGALLVGMLSVKLSKKGWAWLLRQTIEDEACTVRKNLPPVQPGSRGIVMCAGGKYLAEAFASLITIRQSGCSLPVWLVHAGPEEVTDTDRRAFAKAFGSSVRFVDAYDYNLGVDPTSLRGFEIKPYALLLAPFEHTLLLDADCGVLGRNPESLFNDPAYKQSGNIFWPDYWTSAELVRPWMIGCFCDAQMPPGFETESGQVVVNKRRCLEGLVYAWLLNKHSSIFYKHYYGDKDLFRIGFLMAGLPFYQVPYSPGLLGTKDEDEEIVLCAMVQKQPSTGRPLFAHRTMHKRISTDREPLWDLYAPNHGEFGGQPTATWKNMNQGTCLGALCDQVRSSPQQWRTINETILAAEKNYPSA